MPVLVVGVTLVLSMDKYKADDHCWLNVKTDTIWAFVGPVIFVLTVCNLIFAVSVPDFHSIQYLYWPSKQNFMSHILFQIS